MNQFLYSGNFKLNLLLPRHVKPFLSLKLGLALRCILPAHALTFTQPGSPGFLLNWLDSTVKTTGFAASRVDRIRPCLGLLSTTIFSKCNYQNLLYPKGQKMQSAQFKKILEAMFHKVLQVIWTCFYLHRTPSQVKYSPPPYDFPHHRYIHW